MENQAMYPSNSSTPKPEKLKGPALSSSSSSTPNPKKLVGLALSSSSSSTPKPEKLKAPIVAMEKAKMNTSPKQGSPPEVMSERMIENPSFGSNVVRTRGDIMKLYPPKSNKIFACPFCNKGFSSWQALGGHQNAHKQERKWEKKRKEMEAEFPTLWFLNRYTDKRHILLGGCSDDSLSNENHLGIHLDPFKHLIYPSFNNGVIGGSTGMNMTEVPRASPTSFFTANTSTNYGSSSSRVPNPLPNNISPLGFGVIGGSTGMNMTYVPRASPTSFFIGNTSTNDGSSSSRVPNPLPNNISPLSFLERNVFSFPPPTTKISGNIVSQDNVLSEENFISKIGENNAGVIDDDDDMQPEERKSKTGGIDLSLSL